MAPPYFPLDVPQPSLEMWATAHDNEQAYATQSQPFQFRFHGEVNDDDFIDFTPMPAPPAQWWYPEVGGAGWDEAYSESQYSHCPPSESTDIV